MARNDTATADRQTAVGNHVLPCAKDEPPASCQPLLRNQFGNRSSQCVVIEAIKRRGDPNEVVASRQ